MNLAAYQDFCKTLGPTTYVQQWGGAHVWKIGGKVFAIGGWSGKEVVDEPFVTFKCSELSFDILKEQKGMRPAPYLASRGLKWIQVQDHKAMGDATLQKYIKASYQMIADKLTKKIKAELGF